MEEPGHLLVGTIVELLVGTKCAHKTGFYIYIKKFMGNEFGIGLQLFAYPN